jgi:hypothetical protein
MAGFGIWGALSFNAILLLAVALIHRAVLREPDRFIRRVNVFGFIAKMVGSVARFFVLRDVYGRGGDAYSNLSNGTEVAATLRSRQLPEEPVATGEAPIDRLAGIALAYFGEPLPRDEMTEGSAVDQVFSETFERTSTGSSEFALRPVESPAGFGHALITVPFRPFPNEAHNPRALLASFEGLLLGLVILSLRRMESPFGSLLRRPHVVFSAAFSAGFIVAFSNVGNFGTRTRQRAQLIPLVVVILCLPTAKMAFEQRRDRYGTAKHSGSDEVADPRPRPTERARVGS